MHNLLNLIPESHLNALKRFVITDSQIIRKKGIGGMTIADEGEIRISAKIGSISGGCYWPSLLAHEIGHLNELKEKAEELLERRSVSIKITFN